MIPLFDAHCDTATTPAPLRRSGRHVDLARLGRYAPAAQVFAIWAPPERACPTVFCAALDRLLSELAANADLAVLCRSAAEARLAAQGGRIAAFVSAEGASLLDCDTARLGEAYDRGLRMVNLTWNRSNALAGAALDGGAGLSGAGKAFVRAAQRMGVAVDLSHSSERTFWDVLDCAEKPVLASHSNARALCGHPRNLTDAQFSALAEGGGCAGLNLCPDFLGLGRDLDAVIAHAEHFLALGGERALCLGCDFDGIEQTPAGLSGVEDLEALYEAMLRRGYAEELAQNIFYNNLMDFLERAL